MRNRASQYPHISAGRGRCSKLRYQRMKCVYRGTSKAGSSGNSSVCPMRRAAGGHPCRGRPGNDPGNHSGPEVMLSDFKCSCPVYLACGYTDLRRGIDGLVGLVQTQFRLDHSKMHCFCSAGGGRIGSKGCTGRETGLCCCISGWRAEVSSGRGTVNRRGSSRRSSTDG